METTNFFSSIAALKITGDLQVTVRKGAESNWIVSVMLNNEQCGDEARKLIPPLNLRGSAEELDNGFFERITTPIQTASGLMVNMEGFMKQLEEVKKQSAMEKDKADRERKEKEGREKKYTEAMQKVDELEKEGKHRDAWMKVPDPSEYPEQAEAIRRRKSSLSSKFAPDLFGATATSVTDEQPQSDEANVEEEETNQ
jgi:PRTRC genetic system protein E